MVVISLFYVVDSVQVCFKKSSFLTFYGRYMNWLELIFFHV